MTLAAMGAGGAQNSTPKILPIETGSFFLRPTSDDVNTNWEGDGGPMWSQINEVVADDFTSAVSSSGAGNRHFTVFCENPEGILPANIGNSGVIVRCRHRGLAGPPPAAYSFGIQIHSGSTLAGSDLIQVQSYVGDNQEWGDRILSLDAANIAAMGDWKDAIILVSSQNATPDAVSQVEIEFVGGPKKPTV